MNSSWIEKNINKRQLTIILSFFIGLLASVAALILHWLILHIQTLLANGFNIAAHNWLYLVFPVVGITLTRLYIRYFVKDDISHGITKILYAISMKRSHIKMHNCWSSVVASALTIGFGGSVGAEAPIVLTGSAIASNLGQRFRLDNKTLMLLVGCGASAAIAAIFKAPMAGLVFTLEVLMIDLSMASLLPILTACVTATCITYIFAGSDYLFSFRLDYEWTVKLVPADVLLGIFCALVSIYFIRVMATCERYYSRLSDRPMAQLLTGGLVLSLLIFLFPSLYGEGYDALNILLNGKEPAHWDALLDRSLFAGHGSLLLPYLSLVVLTKVFATSATNGAGGVGGTFAPSLFIGGFSGFLFSQVWNLLPFTAHYAMLNPQLSTFLGMAGVMAGVMHAPLTGIFLIAEITGGYQLLLPLIIVSVVAVIAISVVEPHSIYAIRLARQGRLVTHHIDHSVLTLISLESVIDREYTAATPDQSLGSLVHAISRSNTGFLPVVDGENILLGEIDINNMRHLIFRTELYSKFQAQQVMTPPKATLQTGDAMTDVMSKFEATDAVYLPVVDAAGHLLGFVSRSRLYSLYRKTVADFSAD